MKRRSPVAFGYLIVLLAILVMQLDFTGLKNRMYPNTTFTKEVIEKIGNKEVTSMLLIQYTGNTLVLKNKEDTDQILDSLAPLKLKRVKKLPDTSIETYYIILRNQGEKKFGISLYDTKHMVITNYKNSSTERYKITNDIDLDKIKKYLENGK
ncbi:hypothetical protein [Paenibacillus sp. FSL R10-2734]|uniref:hypothetical protein n=1 Tax=Paenibacillus sp. FSL R10-2734 TaxID=2954691 RepID=UPI0030D75504